MVQIGINNHAIDQYRIRVSEDESRQTRPSRDIRQIIHSSIKADPVFTLLEAAVSPEIESVVTLTDLDGSVLGDYGFVFAKRTGRSRGGYRGKAYRIITIYET